MLIGSRLLALLFLFSIHAYALPGNSHSSIETGKPGKNLFASPKETTEATENTAPEEIHETISDGFPFNTETVPTVVAPKPAARVVESFKVTRGQCNTENHLQKSLLVMAFPRLKPTSSSAGDLYQAEHQLPELISQQLTLKNSTIAPLQLSQALPTANASDEKQLSMQTQRLGSDYRSQIIVSGEIIDMSMTTPDATYNPSLYTRFLNGLFDFIEAKNRFEKRERLFSFQVHLRDGFTGQELFTKRYDTYGVWGLTQPIGFGTPLFWKTDYGQQIKGLIKMASQEVSETIKCQPFMAQVDARPGQNQIILQGGANNGLHTGDTLALYQLVLQGSENHYQEHDVRLVNRNAVIELHEVYPSHSVGVINSTTYYTGQFLAVAP